MMYITPKEFLDLMQWKKKVTSNKSNGFTLEELELDTNFNRYFFENSNLVSDEVKVFYDNSSGDKTELLIEDDYELNVDEGYITLTSAGETKIGASKLYAEYSYSVLGISTTYLTDLLTRVSNKVNLVTNAVFIDGSQPNPEYPHREINMSNQGFYDRYYYPIDRPLIDLTSKLAADVSKSDTTIQLETNTGDFFPKTGKILIGREIIEYTDITNDVITVVRGDTPENHFTGEIISTTMIEVSNEFEGLQIIRYPFDYEYKVLTYEEEFTITDAGTLYLYQHPRNFRVTREIEGRVTMRYLYGYQTIPEDIKRLTFLYAMKELTSTTIGRSLIEGRDEFNPEMFNFDSSEINMIINKYKVVPMTNT